MTRRTGWKSWMLVNITVIVFLLLFVFGGNEAISTAVENQRSAPQRYIIIDAGHGGIDGGATSCTGVLESKLNLDIAIRLNDLLHLLGKQTIMIRTEDVSIYTEGESIAAKKVSDLKNRVKKINEKDNAILISIHQNFFNDSRYSGAQVFYANTDGSKDFAEVIQAQFKKTLNPNSRRQVKKASGIYLMNHIQCTGVLIECGFLSNPVEESQLCSDIYQKKICCVIASSLSSYLKTSTIT